MLRRFRFMSLACCLSISGCAPDKTIIEITNDMLERCWNYVDSGDFVERGLYWVDDTNTATYDDRVYKVRVSFDGVSLQNLHCHFYSHPTPWAEHENHEVFEYVASQAPIWLSQREPSQTGRVPTLDLEDRDYARHRYFGTLREGDPYVLIYELTSTGTLHVKVGRSYAADK